MALKVQVYQQGGPVPTGKTFKIPDVMKGGLYEVKEHTANLVPLGAPIEAHSYEVAWEQARKMVRHPVLEFLP